MFERKIITVLYLIMYTLNASKKIFCPKKNFCFFKFFLIFFRKKFKKKIVLNYSS